MTRPDVMRQAVRSLRPTPEPSEETLTMPRLLLLVAVCCVFWAAVGFAIVAMWSAR